MLNEWTLFSLVGLPEMRSLPYVMFLVLCQVASAERTVLSCLTSSNTPHMAVCSKVTALPASWV